MLLSNQDILRALRGDKLRITPFEIRLVRPASVCLRLGTRFLALEAEKPVDVKDACSYPGVTEIEACAESGFSLPPKQLVLSHTLERIALSRDIGGFISNLSGLARLGLQVAMSTYITPGYGENGLCALTLELFNHLDSPVKLYPGMRICHLILSRLTQRSTSSYDSEVGTYSDQSLPRPSRFHTDFGRKGTLSRRWQRNPNNRGAGDGK